MLEEDRNDVEVIDCAERQRLYGGLFGIQVK